MGASFETKHFEGIISTEELQDKYDDYFESLQTEYGSNPYSGQLCALPCKLVCFANLFDTEEEAGEWIPTTMKSGKHP